MLKFAQAGVRWQLLVLILVASLAAHAAATPQSPRPHSWVRDDAGMLAPAAEQHIDATIELARAQRSVELAVVTVADAGTDDTRRYATELFNAWGIGDPQRHDGVLIFIAREQRAAEIILGDGIDSDAEVATSQRIMDGVLVPHMRRGDPAGGLLATVEAVLQQIHGIAAPAVETGGTAMGLQSGRADALDAAPSTAAPRSLRAPEAASDADAPLDRLAKHPVTWGSGGLLALFGAFALRWWWRIRGRRCPRCHAAMQRLSETADDAHLQPAQRLEEQLGSVDYDVWACTACSFVDTRRYGAWFTRYARCEKCQTAALERNQTTVLAATYDHGGRVRVDEHCKHCDHRHSYERSTPRRTRSSSSGGSSGFSGGRSSGRGASGRW
jgi:uncharacterized protein